MMPKHNYTCGIVENEELAISLLQRYIGRLNFLTIKWVKPSVPTVLAGDCEEVDIIFLDLTDTVNTVNSKIDSTISNYGNVILTTAHGLDYVGSLDIKYQALLNKPFSYKIFESVTNEVISNIKN